MAEKRMFSKQLIESDDFLELSNNSQLLYLRIALAADDEGFMNKPKSIMKLLACDDSHIEELVNKGYLIRFESGVVLITHWLIHNKIRQDRMKDSTFSNEKSRITVDESSVFRLVCKKEQASDFNLMELNEIPDAIPDDYYSSQATSQEVQKQLVREEATANQNAQTVSQNVQVANHNAQTANQNVHNHKKRVAKNRIEEDSLEENSVGKIPKEQMMLLKVESEKTPINQNFYGPFRNVILTQTQYQCIQSEGIDYLITDLSKYMHKKGRAYNDHYETILKWHANNKERTNANAINKENFPRKDNFNVEPTLKL